MAVSQDTHITIMGVTKDGKANKKSKLVVKGQIRIDKMFFCVGQPQSEIRISLFDVEKLFRKRARGGRQCE